MGYTEQYLQSEMAAQGLEVIVLVNFLVQDAIRLGASDLHIEPWEDAVVVRARVNGVLTELTRVPLDLLEKISTRFKVMANLVTYQAGAPQDGTAIGGAELDNVQLRVSIFPTTRGEKTGYSGRMSVSELLVVTEPFREAILRKMPTSALEEIAIQQGLHTLWQNGLERAITGQTTLEEIIRVLAADMF